MGQISNIISGWKKYIKGELTDDEMERAKKCAVCPHAVVGVYEKFMPDNSLKEIEGLKCGKCDCPLSTKIRSANEYCPIGKW